MTERENDKPTKRSYIRQCAVMFMGTYILLGVGLTATSVYGHYRIQWQFGELIKFYSQCAWFYTQIWMSLATGVGALCTAPIILLASRKGKWHLGVAGILFLFLALGISTAVFSLYSYRYVYSCRYTMTGSSSLDRYGVPKLDEFTRSWDDLQARLECCIHTEQREYQYSGSGNGMNGRNGGRRPPSCIVLAYKEQLESNTLSCPDAFVEWQGWSPMKAEKACHNYCSQAIDDTLNCVNLSLAITTIVITVFQLILILHQLFSICDWSTRGSAAGRVQHRPFGGSLVPASRQVELKTTCTMFTRTLSCSCVCRPSGEDIGSDSSMLEPLVFLDSEPVVDEKEEDPHQPQVKKEISDMTCRLVDV